MPGRAVLCGNPDQEPTAGPLPHFWTVRPPCSVRFFCVGFQKLHVRCSDILCRTPQGILRKPAGRQGGYCRSEGCIPGSPTRQPGHPRFNYGTLEAFPAESFRSNAFFCFQETDIQCQRGRVGFQGMAAVSFLLRYILK